MREELIDDSPPYIKDSEEEERLDNPPVSTKNLNVLNWRTVKAMRRKALKRGKVLVVENGRLKLKPYSDYLAEKIAERNPVVAEIYMRLKREASNVKSERVLVGLALFIYYSMTGMSKTKALKMAARESYASEKSIASAALRYRPALEAMIKY